MTFSRQTSSTSLRKIGWMIGGTREWKTAHKPIIIIINEMMSSDAKNLKLVLEFWLPNLR
jgi:hypothetical protein